MLVGLPGVGKSTVGAGVAAALGRPFLDFDLEIERRERRTIAELFRACGEPYFREREFALTVECVGAAPMVLAPGGGWVAQPGAMALLRPPACIIYLAAAAASVAARVGVAREARPLLRDGDLLAGLDRLLREREAYYRAADVVVDTELLDEQQVIRRVTALALGRERG